MVSMEMIVQSLFAHRLVHIMENAIIRWIDAIAMMVFSGVSVNSSLVKIIVRIMEFVIIRVEFVNAMMVLGAQIVRI